MFIKLWKTLIICGLVLIGNACSPKSALASGDLGTINANSTITIINSTSTLRYVGIPSFTGTIVYLRIGCGGVYYDLLEQNTWFEKECSAITLKNTNLTSSYSYSVIYGDTTEISLLTQIANASTSVSIPDPIRTIPYEAFYATNSSGTIEVLIEKSWTYGELFSAFFQILIMTLLVFYAIFFVLK